MGLAECSSLAVHFGSPLVFPTQSRDGHLPARPLHQGLVHSQLVVHQVPRRWHARVHRIQAASLNTYNCVLPEQSKLCEIYSTGRRDHAPQKRRRVMGNGTRAARSPPAHCSLPSVRNCWTAYVIDRWKFELNCARQRHEQGAGLDLRVCQRPAPKDAHPALASTSTPGLARDPHSPELSAFQCCVRAPCFSTANAGPGTARPSQAPTPTSYPRTHGTVI
jgi:hypothetical protein